MNNDDIKRLKADTDGLLSYEYLANNIETCPVEDLDAVIDNIINVNTMGQFTTSAARYLNAIDAQRYAPQVARLVEATIDTDREHRYLPTLAASIYGADYKERAEELSASDNNFRRLYKRIYQKQDSL